jgi:uncharacterized protein with GYD domain
VIVTGGRVRVTTTPVGRGMSNTEIAASLFISKATAKAYVARLLAKLGARDRGLDADPGDCRRMRPARYWSAESAGRVGAGGGVMAKYLVLFGLTGEATKGFVAKPSDRVAALRASLEPMGASLESYYWMFGQYDGMAIIETPDSLAMAALSLRVTSTGSFSRFESHELIEAGDLAAIADRARGVSYQAPGE